MPPKGPKRRREGGGFNGSGGGGGGSAPPPASSPAPELKKRCRSFDLEIRGCRHLQDFATTIMEKIDTAITRIPEQMTKVLTSFFNRAPEARVEHNLPPTYRLSFVNSLSDEIFTRREVQAADGGLIKIRITVSNQQGSCPPCLLSAKVKVVVLDGDFNGDNRESWTSEDFSNHIIRPRDRVGVVLTGDLDLKLKNGEAYLENTTFADNSRFTRSGKFRLGVMLNEDLGEQVQESITESFIVKDRRGEGYKKCEIPRLDDEMFRLKKIAKNGVYHKALKLHGIATVKHFLRLYHKDAKYLRYILNKASPLAWTTIVNHAKKCDPGRVLYSHLIEDKDIRLYFSSVGQIVGATIADQYNAFDDLDMPLKALLDKWSKDAYECMTYHQPDYEMYNGQPRPISHSTLQGSIMKGSKSTKPTVCPDKTIHEADQEDTSNGNEFPGSHSQQCTPKRLGSVRVRPLPSAHENDDGTDASFGIDIQIGSGPEIQYKTVDANWITGSVTLHCPNTAENGTIGSVSLDQGALTTNEGSYPMPLTNDDSSLCQSFPVQEAASQYAYPMFPDSEIHELLKNLEQDQLLQNFLSDDDIALFSGPNVSKSPADVGCSTAALASCGRWIKLAALVKWMAMTRASKRKAHA